MPRILKVDPQNPDPNAISTAVQTVRQGGIFVYPTDTIYGLGADALNPQAVLKVFKVKGRPLDQALPLAVADLEMAKKLAFITEKARRLIENFWPGALTIVLKRRLVVPSEVTAGRVGVGLRAPNHLVPLSIIRESNLPLVTTSANKHGKPSPTTAEDAIKQIGEEVDLIIDAGGAEIRVGSTVIDLTKKPPVILRRGPISKESIEAVIGFVKTAS